MTGLLLSIDLSRNFLLQNLVNAISLGSLYALIALGMALTFGIMRLVNFAHGELLMVGGYALALFAGPTWPVLLLMTLAISMFFALAMERIAFRPVRNADASTLLVTSFAVSYFLENGAMLIFGPLPKSTNISNSLLQSWQVGAIYIGKLNALTVALTLILLALLGLFLARTSIGVQMRAAAEDFGMARFLGVRANTVIAVSFAIAGLLAGVASFLLVAQTGAVFPQMGLQPVLVGFVAIVLGGMGSLQGAVVGGFLLGLISVALQAYLPLALRSYRDVFTYTIVLAVILIRPQGLIVARRERQRT
jgi:branched-chain amino acid transport system permease protein